MFLCLENYCFNEKKFFIFSKQFEAYLKIFITDHSSKILRGKDWTKGRIIGSFFTNTFLCFEKDCFHERKRCFLLLSKGDENDCFNEIKRFLIFSKQFEVHLKIFNVRPKSQSIFSNSLETACALNSNEWLENLSGFAVLEIFSIASASKRRAKAHFVKKK